jgi:branched-chain amino acid transport system substrate-binding protein
MVAADQARQVLGASTASIIRRDDLYGAGLAAAFRAAFEAQGGTVLAEASYPADVPDYSAYDFKPAVDQAYAGRPDLVYLVAFESDGARLTFDLKNRLPATGWRPAFMSGEGMRENPFYLNAEPTIAEGMVGTFPALDPQSGSRQAFERQFRERFGLDAPEFSHQAYDATMLAVLAMLTADSSDPALVKARLREVSRLDPGDVEIGPGDFALARQAVAEGHGLAYTGAAGLLELDAAGDPAGGTYQIYRLERDRSGAFQVVTLRFVHL